MKGSNYIRYQFGNKVANAMLMIAWSSLATYMVLVKSALGAQNIPVFEILVFVASLISLKVVYSLKSINYSLIVLIRLATELVFIIFMLYNFRDMKIAGVSIYAIIMLKGVIGHFENESRQHIEHMVLTHVRYKSYLKEIRKFTSNIQIISGAIGSSIALIALTYLKIDLYAYTQIMLMLNVASIIYDIYVWNKFLRRS